MRDVSDDVEGSIVDLATRALDEAIAGAPPESRPILAEAALARFVILAESRLRTPSGRPSRRALRALWADVAAELGVRTGEPALVLTAGLRRLLPADDRPPFEQLWRTGPPDPPGWIGSIGQVRLTGALMTADLAGDGYNVVLAYDDHAGGHTIVVYVDNNLGGIAKDVFPGPPVATVRATYGGQDDILVREVSISRAVGLLQVALERTADAPPGYTSPDFEGFVDLLQLRLRDVAGPIEWPTPPPSLSPGARARLIRQFLRSDHVTELRMPEELIAGVARLWVDHAIDHTVGGPLRISSVLVELFMADWVPRALGPQSPVFLAAVPEVVRAWLRFAADETPVPRSLLIEAVAAIERWAPVMRRRSTDDAARDLPVEQLVPPPDGDELEAMWFSLSELGPAPHPDVTGLDRAMAAKITELARGAWVLAGERLGTDFAVRAFALAERLVREVPELLAGSQLRTWQLAITWVIAEDESVFHTVRGRGLMSAQRWAHELGTTPRTMQAKATAIREALGLPLPD